MPAKVQSIDAYLGGLGDAQRTALEALRQTIRAAAPGAEECISYKIPGFRFKGRLLVSFGATPKHCGFYPGAWPLESCHTDLNGYDVGKGTIRFQPESPLPARLVRKLVKVRVAQYTAGQAPKRAAK